MPALFAINERVLISGTWEHGLFSMVAVGAFNVGSISLEHDKVRLPEQCTVFMQSVFVLLGAGNQHKGCIPDGPLV